MPSSTFYRLPAEKREKLLAASREEFARVPFADASINQIVRRAGVSRGAFYLYFKDKDDLFHYLLDTFISRLMDQFEKLLARCGGDLFAALPAMFDHILSDFRARPEFYTETIHILRNNVLLHVEPILSEHVCRTSGLFSQIDTRSLRLEGDNDLELIVDTLAEITARALKECILSDELAQVRIRYMETLEILKRGIANTPVPCV